MNKDNKVVKEPVTNETSTGLNAALLLFVVFVCGRTKFGNDKRRQYLESAFRGVGYRMFEIVTNSHNLVMEWELFGVHHPVIRHSFLKDTEVRRVL